MSLKLTWSDLIIDNITPDEASRWLGEWSWLVEGKLYPVFLSKFGDWFLRRPEGSTEMLDVLEGTISTIARTPEEFQAEVNRQEWQEERLLSLLVYQLHLDGKIPGPGQCYGFAPHPRLGGAIDLKNVVILDIFVWQSLCSQFCR